MSSVDRISALPDDVLCHILSFLPTEASVSTSILGRRWRFLWAYVPNFYFYFIHDHRREEAITKLIYRVMLLSKSKTINTFRLRFCTFCPPLDKKRKNQLKAWITIAIERNVRNLDLDIMYTLPRCLFTCKTLADLRLANYQGFPPSDAVYLPSLRKLYLRRVQYENGEALNRFLSGCPVLDDLIIEYDIITGHHYISSDTIKNLVISVPTVCILYSYDYTVKINAPALRYIRACDSYFDHISLSQVTMTSLIEAYVVLPYNADVFIQSLCNVNYLILKCGSAKCFDSVDPRSSIAKYGNLTGLETEHFLYSNSNTIVRLLEIADNLEILVIYVCLVAWMSPKQAPACLLSHLRIIRYHEMWCKEHEFDMVKYVLVNAKVLKRMDIYFLIIVGSEEKSDAVERISLFERGSEACELVFH